MFLPVARLLCTSSGHAPWSVCHCIAVTEEAECSYGSERNVTCHIPFPSLEVARALSQNRATIEWTPTLNKRFIPKESTEKKNRPAESSLAFIRTRSKRWPLCPLKVLAVFTNNSAEVVISPKSKPGIILFYKSTKGDVTTVVNWIVKKYTYRKVSRTWLKVLFLNVVDAVPLSACIIWNLNHPEGWWTGTRGRQKHSLRIRIYLLARP